MRAKGNSGKHVTTLPPLGYMKDPEDKDKWIVDEEGALIVKEIFNLCVKGYLLDEENNSTIKGVVSRHA